MKSTIKDVARRARVSIATVSRVVNNLPGYLPATRERVLKAVRDLNYFPNNSARVLAGKSHKSLGVLIPKLSSMVASLILAGIEDAAHEAEQSVIVCNTDNDGKRTMKYLNLLDSKGIDGLLIVSEFVEHEYVERIKNMKLKVVLIATEDLQHNFFQIKVNDRKAAYDATCYLIEQKHKDIAFISGLEDDLMSGQSRVIGFKKALKDHGLEHNLEHIVYGNFTFNSGLICMQQILKKMPRITAVFAASDEMALGALSAAYNAGYKVPDQISIMGYDNTQLATMSTPALTTVDQRFYQMGKQGFDMLDNLMQGKKIKSQIMSHKIAVRDSVKKFDSQ